MVDTEVIVGIVAGGTVVVVVVACVGIGCIAIHMCPYIPCFVTIS